MTRSEWMAGDDAVVGVVGPETDRDRLTRLGDDVDVVSASTVEGVVDRDPAFLVAAGESATSSIARAAPPVPVLPVEAGRGLASVPGDRVESAVESILEGAARVRETPVLSVESDGVDPQRALYDVTIVTEEPARISEYAVETGADRVTRIRADGVVVATPAGSHGYAAAAGGPIVSGTIDGVAVVPISPFVTRPRRWVVSPDVTVSIERDEGDIALCVDDRIPGAVAAGTAVSISTAEPLSILVTPESPSPFEPA